MSDTSNGTNNSDSLAKKLAAENLACINNMPNPSKQDLTDLKGILRNTKITSTAVDIKQALTMLTHAEPSAESVEILSRILSNTRQTTKVRVSAAANLSVLGTQDAEKALLVNLDVDDPFIRLEVIKSLGKIGSIESLRCLEAAVETASDKDRKQIAFACTTIAFREGSYDRDSIPGIDWRTQSLKVIEGRQVAEKVEKIWGSTYGVKLNHELGLIFTCGKSTLSVLLNNTLKRGSWLKNLRSKPLIAGVLTIKEHEVKRYSVRYILMTKPTDTGLIITASRTNGDVVFAGKAIAEGDELRLSMRDVGVERTPAEIDGVITNDNIKLDLRTWRGVVRSKSHGEKL